MEEGISGKTNKSEYVSVIWHGLHKELWAVQNMQSLEQLQGEDMRMKQEKYIRLIKKKSKHLAKAMKLYEAGNGQAQME